MSKEYSNWCYTLVVSDGMFVVKDDTRVVVKEYTKLHPDDIMYGQILSGFSLGRITVMLCTKKVMHSYTCDVHGGEIDHKQIAIPYSKLTPGPLINEMTAELSGSKYVLDILTLECAYVKADPEYDYDDTAASDYGVFDYVTADPLLGRRQDEIVFRNGMRIPLTYGTATYRLVDDVAVYILDCNRYGKFVVRKYTFETDSVSVVPYDRYRWDIDYEKGKLFVDVGGDTDPWNIDIDVR